MSLPYTVECRGLKDWVPLRSFANHKDAEFFITAERHADIKNDGRINWVYQIVTGTKVKKREGKAVLHLTRKEKSSKMEA